MKLATFAYWFKTNKTWLLILGGFLLLFSCDAMAVAALKEAKTIADIADNIVQSFQSVGQLLVATAYLAGISTLVSAVFKFKTHRDNPTQVPLSAPVALFIVGLLLLFLPGVIVPAGVTIFGGSKATLEQQAGGFEGKGASFLPGYTE